MAANLETPYGVGRFSRRWWLTVAVLAIVVAFGVYAYVQQLVHGEVVTGMRDLGTMGGAPWGLYVVFLVYFTGIAFAGIALATVIRLLKLEDLQPISRVAQIITIIAVVLGAMLIIADVGKPLRALINLPRYARPQSPMFGTFTLDIVGFLFASIVFFGLDARGDAAELAGSARRFRWLYRFWAAGYLGTPAELKRRDRSSFWLGIAIVPLLIIGHSTLGFVFGLQAGRAGWFSAMQGPGFVVLAGVSGVGIVIIVTAIMRMITGEREKLGRKVFEKLANIMMILVIVYLYFMIVDWLTATYAGDVSEKKVLEAVLTGVYAPFFWVAVAGLLLPAVVLFYQAIRKRYSLGLIVASAVLVNIAAVAKRYTIVVPSQTHGALLPYADGVYSPTWVEYLVVLGLIAFGGLLFALFMKIIPIIKLSEDLGGAEVADKATGFTRRTFLTLFLVVAGFAVQAVSFFLLATPIGVPNTEAFSNPRVPFAAAIFIGGVFLVFVAAIVYELIPDRTGARDGQTAPGVS